MKCNSFVNKQLVILISIFLGSFLSTYAQEVAFEKEVKITDFGLHFDGAKVADAGGSKDVNSPFDYFYGRNISAHGDCIKTYGDYVFMTWYRGGKDDRHVMLTRYNTLTGSMATIEFPHRHTGFNNQWWIGESHNTIGIGISPLDGTIHLLYDMHAYHKTRPTDGSLANDYFRYSHSVKNLTIVPDSEFTLDKFVKNSSGGYKHLSLNGGVEYSNFQGLTYPQFFLNDAGDLFMYMREGGNNNGAYKFSKYNASSSSWSNFTHFNVLNAKNHASVSYNWGLYGNMKYIDGKIRIGFQRRENHLDKYQYQNGVYYAYSDNQNGTDSWKSHSGTSFSLPLYDADFIKVMEPGDYVQTTQTDKVYIVADFDWTVTAKGDVHIISKVKDNENNVTKSLHTYKPAGATEFITSEDFAGGTSIYTSGENVYIIGLTSSRRVFVDKAVGGTNKFTRVYEATSGRVFDHGRVHINKGKLYYYLMEKKTGNSQPIYLQIIDLGIVDEDPKEENNFTIQAIGETCENKNNGILIINAKATHDYVATINGVDYDFTKNKTIENLNPGTYNLCIEVIGEDHEQCYEVVIDGYVSLSGGIQISEQSAIVSVATGNGPFRVFKNGEEVLETYDINFSVAVHHGDEVEVKSKSACQGVMTKSINLYEEITAYPNPSNGNFELFVPENLKSIFIEIYNVQSQLITANEYSVNRGKVFMDMSDQPNGIYFVKLNSMLPTFIKVVKN
ncbi:BNR-4 repeat-containing protein [Flavicella sediminum]|uniref:BNR-4 repeat-containing protein n=1 Tax=Flavicella sediminum TaxID=2585141 RepID=UPI001121987E|nr:BNR-4 repeat-containing protein [Flavicella sediminum]